MIDDFRPNKAKMPRRLFNAPPSNTAHRISAPPTPINSLSQAEQMSKNNIDTTLPESEPDTGHETIEQAEPVAPLAFSTNNKRPASKRFTFLRIKWQGLSRKKKIALALLSILLLSGIAGLTLLLTQRNKPVPPAAPAPEVIEKKEEPPKPTTETSSLSGLQVPIGTNATPVTGVMIENSPDARPQSGLKDASIVFEAIAEGGITRFLALYQDTQPDYIGPIRSVRPYYVDWLMGFDAAVAHVGGSPEALQKIRNLSTKDLDQFYNSAAYDRVNSRYAPHNVYTSIARLLDIQKNKGWTNSQFTGFARKAEQPSGTPTANTIDLNISSYLYNVSYNYDAVSNSYKRNLANKPHVDERSGAQISPKVVIALVMPYSIQSDGIHSVYGTIGSGKAYIFQDGVVTEGTWEKTSPTSQLRFGDANGSPIGINPGQTWITAVSEASKVSHKP